jgi:MFS family permease
VGYYDAMPSEAKVSQHTIKSLLTSDFLCVFFAFFALLCATHVLTPTFPIYLESLGSNTREVGVLVGMFGVATLVSRVFVGRALLKHPERNVMICGALLYALTFLALIVFYPFWPVLAVRVFQGIAFASLHTAALAYSVKVVPPRYRSRGIAYFMLAPNLAVALSAPFGMFLINRYSFISLFLAGAALSLCALGLSSGIRQQEVPIPDPGSPMHMRHVPEWKIIVPAITSFMQTFVYGALVAFFSLYAIQCGVTNPGYFFTANAVMIIAVRILGGTILDTYSKTKIIPIFICISMVAMLVLSFSRTLHMFVFVGLLWGLGGAFFYPASMAYSLEYAGSSGGTAVSIYLALMDLGMALGPVIMGIIIPLTGYRAMFLFLTLICLINLIYFQFYVKKRGNVAPAV